MLQGTLRAMGKMYCNFWYPRKHCVDVVGSCRGTVHSHDWNDRLPESIVCNLDHFHRLSKFWVFLASPAVLSIPPVWLFRNIVTATDQSLAPGDTPLRVVST